MDYLEFIRRNLKQVQERIADAALRAGRSPSDIQLVAVSKTHPAEAVLAAWECSQREFGENRPEEGEEKIPKVLKSIKERHPIWHMIGTIQRRKAKLVIAYFDRVHSVDRLAVAEKLSQLAVEANRTLPVMIECNVSGEESKYGYQVSNWEKDEKTRTRFFHETTKILALPNLRVDGLMTMAPLTDDPETVRPVFISLRNLRDALRTAFPQNSWAHLSMGMTDDFEVAVEEGATLVRIGRAIFGTRQV